MEKLLFVMPPNITYENFINPPQNVKVKGKYGVIITDMPLGILSLDAYMKKFIMVESKVVDFNVVLNKVGEFCYDSFTEFFLEYLLGIEYEPTIIAISTLFTTQYRNMVALAQCCRSIFPKAVIVAGGAVPTNMYKEIFQESNCFDGLCYGEGERALVNLVQSGDRLAFLEANPTWITRRKAENGLSFHYDFIENLDDIPFADYGILDIEEYGLSPTIAAYIVDRKGLSVPIMTSRGCPFHCCFCAAHTIRGRTMRYYTVARIKEDIRRLKNEYGATTIIIQDDHLMSNRQRALDIFNILREFQLTVFFPNALALYALDREVLETLTAMGVNELVLALESGSDRVLKEIVHKPLNLRIAKRVVDDCRELGIYTDCMVSVGFPGERKSDIEDSEQFLKSLGANWYRINIATPLIGSEMLVVCIEKGYLRGSLIDGDFKKAVIETEDFTTDYIQEISYLLNLGLNFVWNSDLRLGNYGIALGGFEKVIAARPDHALAYYYASQCCRELGNVEKGQDYLNIAKGIIETNNAWRGYAKMFNISLYSGVN